MTKTSIFFILRSVSEINRQRSLRGMNAPALTERASSNTSRHCTFQARSQTPPPGVTSMQSLLSMTPVRTNSVRRTFGFAAMNFEHLSGTSLQRQPSNTVKANENELLSLDDMEIFFFIL